MKNKILILLLVICSLCSFYCSAQTNPIDVRFKGGKTEFIGFMNKHLKYPPKSCTKNIIGYSITGITITPNGDIAEVFTVNPLAEDIDQHVIALLSQTKGYWLKSDSLTNQTFYVQVIFQILNTGDEPNTNTSLVNIHNFVDPIYITAMSLKNKVKLESNELIAQRIDECMKSNKMEEAVNYTDELIRRNPFLPGMYQLRISLNQRLKRNDLVTKDVNKLQNFIPGVSLDSFLTAFSEAQEKERLLSQQTAAKIVDASDFKGERMPEFPGGTIEMMKFINKNLKYPVIASSQKIQGTAVVEFIVEKDGKIGPARIFQSVHPSVDAEALRVISLMPGWTPGIQEGKPVRVSFKLPFRFVLDRVKIPLEKD